MAATDFKEVAYETDLGIVMRLRADVKTLTAYPGSAGAIDLDAHVMVGRGRRTHGVHARGVRLTKPGATSIEKDLNTFIPVAVKATWDGLAIGGIVTGYAGYIISKKVSEVRS